jgi:hypothetical protein
VGPYERESTDGPAQWRYRIGDLHVHAGFDMSHMRHDLMLFRIQPVSLANLRPIRFNLESDVPRTGQKLTAIGMGLNDDGVTSNALEGVTLTAVSDKQCYNEWSTNGDRQIDRKSMVCASTTGGKDVCNGEQCNSSCVQVYAVHVLICDFRTCSLYLARKATREGLYSTVSGVWLGS